MRKGDLVLISFPFTNLKGAKRRPAVVLLASEIDIIVCFITSKFDITSENSLIIEPHQKNGLKRISAIRVDKIATLDKGLVKGKIGELFIEEISEVNVRLRKILEL
ncbi:MAG: type II toxin-antitoxin system PemK/MazF family toxin [Salinimicrobium sp.]